MNKPQPDESAFAAYSQSLPTQGKKSCQWINGKTVTCVKKITCYKFKKVTNYVTCITYNALLQHCVKAYMNVSTALRSASK